MEPIDPVGRTRRASRILSLRIPPVVALEARSSLPSPRPSYYTSPTCKKTFTEAPGRDARRHTRPLANADAGPLDRLGFVFQLFLIVSARSRPWETSDRGRIGPSTGYSCPSTFGTLRRTNKPRRYNFTSEHCFVAWVRGLVILHRDRERAHSSSATASGFIHFWTWWLVAHLLEFPALATAQ